MQPLFLHSEIYQTLFVAAVILFAVQQLPALWSTFRMKHGAGAASRDRGSYTVVQVTVLAGVILGYRVATQLTGATITWHRPLVYLCGIGFMVVSSALSW